MYACFCVRHLFISLSLSRSLSLFLICIVLLLLALIAVCVQSNLSQGRHPTNPVGSKLCAATVLGTAWNCKCH